MCARGFSALEAGEPVAMIFGLSLGTGLGPLGEAKGKAHHDDTTGRRIRTGGRPAPSCSSKRSAASYALPMTCRVEVFVRSGHIDLALEDSEDRSFANALHQAWAALDAIGYKLLALGKNAAILASEVVGYRLHGSRVEDSAM
jgi:hypothetical protein